MHCLYFFRYYKNAKIRHQKSPLNSSDQIATLNPLKMDILNKKQLPRSALQKSRWSKSCSGFTLKYWCRDVIPGSFVKITSLHGCSPQRSALWFEEHHPLKAPWKKYSVDLLHHLTYSFYQEHMQEAVSQQSLKVRL